MNANVNKTNTGKLLVAVLAMFMVVAGAAIVFSDDSSAEIATTDVASIGDQSYATLDAAVDAANASSGSDVITLHNDATLSKFLNNVTIKSAENQNYTITLQTAVQLDNAVTIENVTIAADGDHGMLFYVGNYEGTTPVTFNLNRVTFDASTIGEDGKPMTVYNDKSSTITMSGCDLQNSWIVYAGADGKNPDLTISDCTNVGMTVTTTSDTAITMGGVSSSCNIKVTESTIDTLTLADNASVDVTDIVPINEVTYYDESATGKITGHVEQASSTASSITQAINLLETFDEVTLTSVSELELETDFIIKDGKTLNIVNTTINGVKADGSCPSFLVSGNLNISNSYVYAGVNVDVNTEDSIEGVLTVSGSHTLSATGVGNTNLYVGVGDTLNFTGTVPAQRTIYVFGNLVATDISVEGTVNSYVGSSVTLDGTANISGDFIMNDADIEIAGTVNVRNDTNGGADFTLNGKSNVTVLDTGVFNVNKPTAIAATGVNKLSIAADSTFTVEGTLNITGTLTGKVVDKGTINFNGTSDNGVITLYDGVTLTVTSVAGKLVINDDDAVMDVMGENKYNDNKDKVSEGNSVELNNVRGVTVTETITSETVEQNRYYYSNMDVSGTFIVLDNNTTDASVTIKATTTSVGAPNDKKCGEITYSGSSVIGAGVTVINQGELTITGDISVTRSTATGTKSGAFDNTAGEVTVEGSIVMYDAQLAGIVNAMYYTVTGTEATAHHYTGFAAAIAAAGDADSDTVYVQGNVSVKETAEIAAGTYVSVGAGAELTISEGVTLTVADTAALNVVGTVDVDGTLVITNTDTGLSYGTLEYDVYSVNGKTATYTNLANALANANPGDVITIAQDVTLGSNTTIPAEVTVQTGDNAIILKDNVTLTVEGTLAIQRNGELKADDVTPTLVWGTDVRLVIDGVVTSVDATADSAMTQYNAAGAVFQIRNLYYLTTVEYAAGVSTQVEDKINVYGNVSFADVVFTEGENNTLAINFDNIGADDNTFRGNVTLDGATMNVVDGLYTGNITAAAAGSNAVIALNGASNVTIGSSVNEEELEPVDVMTLGGIAGTGNPAPHLVLGNVTVQSGTVTAGAMDLGTTENGVFTVASGATLLVGESSSVGVNDIADVGLIVDGTIAIDDGSFAIAAGGTAVINGTMTVENTTGFDVSIAGTIVIAGTLDISTAEDTAAVVAVSGTLLVGAVPETLGQTTSGSVSGEVDLNGLIIVYTGSSIQNIDVGNADLISTRYYINEVEYATAYTFNGAETIENGLGDIAIDALNFDSTETKWYSDDAMTKEITAPGTALMTANDNVYISAPLSERTGTISAGTGLDLYIDNIKWNGTTNKLAVGTHTVSFDVRAGYDGSNATITFNGQTVENGGTIEITANGFVLVANGAVPSSGQVVVDNGSSDGMGLTDYLLIILVVLIVIMAIMVAMRLMRS